MTACADQRRSQKRGKANDLQESFKRFAFAVILLLTSLACVPVYAQQTQFPNVYGHDFEFTVTLREGRTLLGEIPLQIATDGTLSVPLTDFGTAISNKITPEALQQLLKLNARNGRVSLAELATAGFSMMFDDGQLELALVIPNALKPKTNYSIMDGERSSIGNFDTVSKFSFAANFRLFGDYNRSDFGDNFSNTGSVNLLGRWGQIAYQSLYRFSNTNQAPLRDSTRFIYDDVGRALRWQIGDVRPFSASPIGGEDILGFGVSRETQALQPDYLVRLRGAQTFSIEEPSEVVVSVNGRVVTRRAFAPGNYNISDFPFVIGRNQVDLAIISGSGQRQELSFNQFLDTRLLEAGRDDFGIAIGFPSQQSFNRSRTYDTSTLNLNAHYIRGLSERLTVGFATSLSSDRTNLLSTGVYAGEKGVVSGRLGLNLADNGNQTGVFGVGIVRVLSVGRSQNQSRTLRLGFDTRLDLKDAGRNLYNASVGYTWPITRTLSGSSDVRFTNKSAVASFQTSYNFTRNLSLDVSLDWRFNKEKGQSGPGISIGLSRSFGGSGRGRSNYNSRLEEVRLSYFNTPKLGLGKWSNSIEVANTNGLTNAVAAQSALFNRAEVAVSQSASWQGNRTSQRVGLSLGSAIAFAGGRFAIGRPVTDSFAIISGHKSLGDRMISFEARGAQAGPTARTGLFGPALITGLGTYAPRVVTVNVDDPPAGYDIGSGTFRVLPPLNGGYHFVVGSDAAITVTGILLLPNGKMAALIAGVATSPDWPNMEPIIVFTNATGQFSATGLGPGRWTLKMRGVTDSFEFTVPLSQSNFINLGQIQAGVAR